MLCMKKKVLNFSYVLFIHTHTDTLPVPTLILMTFRCRPAKYYSDYSITGSSVHEQNRNSRTSCFQLSLRSGGRTCCRGDMDYYYVYMPPPAQVGLRSLILFAVIYPPLPVFTTSWLHVGICRETLNSRKIHSPVMVRKTGGCRSQWDMNCWWIKCTAVCISSSDSLCAQKLLRLL